MYITKTLGTVFDQQSHAYRTVYHAIPIEGMGKKPGYGYSLVPSLNGGGINKNQNEDIQRSKTIKRYQSQNLSMRKQIQIQSRIQSPKLKKDKVFKTQQTPIKEQFRYSGTKVQTTNNKNGYSSFKNRMVPENKKRVGSNSNGYKSYYDQTQTQLFDTSGLNNHTLLLLNDGIHELLQQIKKRKTNSHFFQKQTLDQLNSQIIELSGSLKRKNNQILKLQQQLKKNQIYLAKTGEIIRTHQNSLKEQQSYGNAARMQLRSQINSLKKAYDQLVLRLQRQDKHHRYHQNHQNQNNYKQLYEIAERQLQWYRKNINAASLKTGIQKRSQDFRV